MSEPLSIVLARRLIDEESRSSESVNSGGWPALLVCEKLRRPLSTLAGVAGFRSLLTRSLALASKESSWLQRVKINPDGSFDYTAEMKAELDTDKAASGTGAVVIQLLELLITFIGEALTLRLVHDAWPNGGLTHLKSGGDKP